MTSTVQQVNSKSTNILYYEKSLQFHETFENITTNCIE